MGHTDFKNKMLVIPAYKMKLNKEFKLPLSSQALEILEFMYKQKLDKYVFSCALSDKVRMQKKHIKKHTQIFYNIKIY